ncbi:MAG TPA: thiol reductant ABC exporter subunit CydD, partial [Acidimicrobiia bacterium]|nr:thiol reductant ABC exporter subunit CydD [Acidimicrobiia bacterium]
RQHTDRQLRTLQSLSGHFLDVVAGLTTLKVFGRSKAQVETVRRVTDRYRRTTMATLRLAFLSSLVLELFASVAVALVAVSVGLRLLYGHLDLATSLFVLILAPESYLPLRLVGANYHASAEGLSAAEQVFEVLDEPVPPPVEAKSVPDPAANSLVVEGLGVTYPGRRQPALDCISLHIAPGQVLGVTGPNGCGKSTLLAVLLGFVTPTRGSVMVGGTDLTTIDPDEWRARLAWVPQRPHLFAGSLEENLRLGNPAASVEALRDAVTQAGLSDLIASLPEGLDTTLGERGARLSAGERQRVAIARALLRDVPLLLLDEPTAHLDGVTEAEVIEAVRRFAHGRTVVVVAHRSPLLALCDQVVSLASPRAAA